jgi:4-azaleucine resistance transporter AzlC
LKIAIAFTIPVLLGYMSVGIAFGLLVVKSGLSIWLALLMSVFLYAGAMQFVAIQILTNPISMVQVAFMTLFVNIRHLFYGLSFIERFKPFGWMKHYMIFAMTDETYSLMCGISEKQEVDSEKLLFAISALNHAYWICGTLIGALIGNLITFDTAGIEFAMTALFVVIFIEQWLAEKKHLPALTGVLSALVALKLFGPGQMVLPAMVILFSALLLLRKNIEGGVKNG